MKKVLVIYYTQSGQLLEIINSLLSPLTKQDDIDISYEAIQTEKNYPFPWPVMSFLDVMPESVLEVQTDIKQPSFDRNDKYDLIILAYQPWYLSISIPISSFLQSEYAAVLKNTPVITVNGSRNLWLMAHEKIKIHLTRIGAKLVMNIPFIDRAANSATVITTPAWMLSGKKDFIPFLPRAGVSDTDISQASGFGEIILQYLNSDDCKQQKNLTADHPAEVIPRLIGVEKAGRRVFTLWAKLIRAMGKPGALLRKPLLLVFMIYLITVILIIFPLTYFTYHIKRLLNPKGIKRDVNYYSKGE
ncbi:MAG: dialkylresorcinol condensing enzyme [Mariprofundales bacterium]